jgi:hypothetical protein
MPNYSKGKIYRIYSPSHLEDGEYIGSTTQALAVRMASHRSDYRRYISGKKTILCSSKDILKYEDARIELIEEYPCETKEQLLRKEGEYIRGSSKCINRVIAGRTDKEYYHENKEKKCKLFSEWQRRNLEYRNKYKREWREKHKDIVNLRKREKRRAERFTDEEKLKMLDE